MVNFSEILRADCQTQSLLNIKLLLTENVFPTPHSVALCWLLEIGASGNIHTVEISRSSQLGAGLALSLGSRLDPRQESDGGNVSNAASMETYTMTS